ncbi:hypothetical protein HNR46_003687 [Haloferula luteola]|uniref:Uncharacterized protein n=1 Tax=Haloferula luteola TaxID=595692 RepID=A0A840V8P1_9BACT|nr:hypothetical protein [Haloferula luteola]
MCPLVVQSAGRMNRLETMTSPRVLWLLLFW